MSYPQAIEFLYALRWFGAKFGLANTLKLAALAGNPQRQLRFIHVAGTNGKGSTCAMLESIYRAAGLRVGLFSSPHLVAFGERIQINRQPLAEAQTAQLVESIRQLMRQGWGELPAAPTAPAPPIAAGAPIASGGSAAPAAPAPLWAHALASVDETLDYPTFFEAITVMALGYFAAQGCELVIWETGLGGRLDATNIVTPLASVITNIQFDHQKWLGHTLASIAAEKAGIIKPGLPVITGTEAPEALAVIQAAAHQRQAPLRVVKSPEASQPLLSSLPLLGQHQRMNGAVALATVNLLQSQLPVSQQAIETGLSQVQWPGRLQLLSLPSGQKLLLDGAHNVGGAEILADALHSLFPATKKPALILGILRDKDWVQMCSILAPLSSRLLLVPVPSERTAQPHELAQVCRQFNPGARLDESSSLKAAVAAAANEPFLAIAGSLYLIGEAMELLQLSAATPGPERALNDWRA